MHPKLVTLNEYMLGRGYQIYTYGGSVKRADEPPLALQNDYTPIRAPYTLSGVYVAVVDPLPMCL